MTDSEPHRLGVKNLSIEEPEERVDDWFQDDLYQGLGRYVSEVELAEDEDYVFDAWTENRSHAMINYELEGYEDRTDITVNISGGELAVDTVMEAFDYLWGDSGLGYHKTN